MAEYKNHGMHCLPKNHLMIPNPIESIHSFFRQLVTITLHLVRWVLSFVFGEPGGPVPSQNPEGGDALIEVYPLLRGFDALSSAKREQCQRKIDQFHREVQEDLRKIARNNKKYGINLRQTRFGTGMFNGSCLPIRFNKKKPIPLAIYICALSTERQFELDRDCTYAFDNVDLCGVTCVRNAKFTKSSPLNARDCNHSCTPNCYVESVTARKTGISYLVFYGQKDIGPDEELTIDYNDGLPKSKNGRELQRGYWSHVRTLNLTGPLSKYLIKCGCNGGKCPKHRGMDLRVMRPAEAELL